MTAKVSYALRVGVCLVVLALVAVTGCRSSRHYDDSGRSGGGCGSGGCGH